MASLEQDPTSKRYRIRFRYAGVPYKRSLKTTDEGEAKGVLGRVEETIGLLERGRLEMPPSADPGTFILSDGKCEQKAQSPKVRTLGDIFKTYLNDLPPGVKEKSTVAGERLHIKHLMKHLGANRHAQSLSGNDLPRYVKKRSKECWRGKPIRSETIKKELTTFRLIWNWAVQQGYLSGAAPVKGVRLPKTEQKPPFMTWNEIESMIGRGGLTAEEERELWDALFLTAREVEDVTYGQVWTRIWRNRDRRGKVYYKVSLDRLVAKRNETGVSNWKRRSSLTLIERPRLTLPTFLPAATPPRRQRTVARRRESTCPALHAGRV